MAGQRPQQQQQQQQQPYHDRSEINAGWWAPERRRSPTPPPPESLNPPILEPRISQLPMNLARDDSVDGMTLETASTGRTTTNSVWSYQSMRDIHEFIREVDGRRYNAKNTTYFMPAGQSSRPLFRPSSLPPLPLVQTISSTVACGSPIPLTSPLFLFLFLTPFIFSLSDKQHISHSVALRGDLYPRPEIVDFILRPEPGVEKKVLDIGQLSAVIPGKPHSH
jgi:hypothetical protein